MPISIRKYMPVYNSILHVGFLLGTIGSRKKIALLMLPFCRVPYISYVPALRFLLDIIRRCHMMAVFLVSYFWLSQIR
jgi:hypothetical protein